VEGDKGDLLVRLDRLARSTRDLPFERDLIMVRTGEGRKRAMADGVKFGRPAKLTPHQKREAIKRHNEGEALTSITRDFNVSHQTIGRLRPLTNENAS
jgi:DNA invertase Pin-like site-specific DNA recombinase